MNPFSKREIIYLAIVLFVVWLTVFGSRTIRLYSDNAITSDHPVSVDLYTSSNLESLAETLDSLQVNYDRSELLWAGRTLGWRNFRPGRYVIDGGVSYSDFLSNMAKGIQTPARVTVMAGTDKGRLSASLARQLRADSTAFRELFKDSSEIALEMNLTGEELFSRMLPNTYEIFWTANPENVVRKILSEFNRMIENRFSSEIDENSLSLSEIITLASIVEGEARVSSEKPRISGLYLNRLNRNMRLQADPTVLYALGERRRLLFDDYTFDHPYNTYLVSGLPPGPITNPDEASIRAVLQPEDHDYLFMVATPEGSHKFSSTFEEHQRASEEWRRWIREQYRLRDVREEAVKNQ